ncbi:MAG TPA: hypothetical protein VLG09_04085 [Candidatus Saccharimonadales bacterium]|nr:hypothetical protein [Candidatus Saccharimonadales bacterium]
MALVKDLSGNGQGVLNNQNGRGDAIDVSSADATVLAGYRLFVTGAGAVVLRYPASSADITITAPANGLLPIVPGTIVRKNGTAATGLFALPG